MTMNTMRMTNDKMKIDEMRVTENPKALDETTADVTELVFVIDMSGSMAGLESDTVGGFNALVEKQKREAGRCLVSTVLFNDRSKVLYDRCDLNRIRPMRSDDYTPNNSTALIDSLSDAIRHISKVHTYIREEDIPKKTMFVVITDGMENASHKYSLKSLKELIAIKQKSGWEFLFIGANIDAIEVARDFGIPANRAANYHADTKGTDVVYETVSKAVNALRVQEGLKDDWSQEISLDFTLRKSGR